MPSGSTAGWSHQECLQLSPHLQPGVAGVTGRNVCPELEERARRVVVGSGCEEPAAVVRSHRVALADGFLMENLRLPVQAGKWMGTGPASQPLPLPVLHTASFVRGKKLTFTQGMVSGDEVRVCCVLQANQADPVLHLIH